MSGEAWRLQLAKCQSNGGSFGWDCRACRLNPESCGNCETSWPDDGDGYVLWVSRHNAPKELEFDYITTTELLWPEDFDGCMTLVMRINAARFEGVYGVFPSQALEALRAYNGLAQLGLGCHWYSAVNRPVYEPDTNKVRGFEFVRWAVIA